MNHKATGTRPTSNTGDKGRGETVMVDVYVTARYPDAALSMSDSTSNPQHLNNTGCIIRNTPDKGRGVYASYQIPRNTLIEISPVLLFDKDEYEAHGKYTILDHYTFSWPGSRMALALGLGSLFNHSDSPNVSYTLDPATDSIRYTSLRDVNPGEELCIFYGHKLWFMPVVQTYNDIAVPEAQVDDGWGGLSTVEPADDNLFVNPYLEGDPDEIILEEDLPFTLFKLPPEEEEVGSIRTAQAWVVDIPDQRHITTMLKWLKQIGLDTPDLGHLKRIRKQDEITTLLLSATSDPPNLPADLNLPTPYLLPVPTSSALTLPSLNLKSALWPTLYTPRRKDEPEPWTRSRLRWAWDAMKRTVDAAITAQAENGDLPIAGYIPAPFTPEGNTLSASCPFIGHDTRQSTKHPLRHAVTNTIRQVVDDRAVQVGSTNIEDSTTDEAEDKQNFTNYLLTDQTFFITHEPCIMCSMALLHSRVKEVMYLYRMPKTGGCGGNVCLPTLKGVNHRFSICQWRSGGQLGQFSHNNLHVEATIDA